VAITGYDEDKVLLESAVKAVDGTFTTFMVSPYSRYIARWAAHRGLTPNQVTSISMLIGILAAAAFATGERWGMIVGAVLLQAAFTTDCVDGQLARYTRQFSKLGAWLDSVFDRGKEYVVFAGLAIGASRMGEPAWTLAAAALALQTTRHTFDFSFAAAQHQVIGATHRPPLDVAYDGAAPKSVMSAAPVVTVEVAEEVVEPPPFTIRDVPKRILRFWRRFDRLPAILWIKRSIAFPIGERFAAISLTAALFTPRVTFIVLLAWGGFAGLYTFTGRLLRSLSK
jgi:phosphatidylglycerophosphate synthase